MNGLWKWLAALVAAWFVLGGTAGCMSQGHRKVSIDFFGQNITIEDQTYPDSTGEQSYTAGFVPLDPFVNWIFPKAEAPPESIAAPTDL